MTGLPAIEIPGALRPVAPDQLLLIVGETASGKTALAIDLARRYGGEIIGADSVQVYRGFDIGSGKPTPAELGGVAHHLVDIADPEEPFDAGRFVALADDAISSARARGRIPIVCGGTYLWTKALVFGLAQAPSAPAEQRAALQREAANVGAPALHARLAIVDPVTAARLHPNDAVRVIRALEVVTVSGRPLSAWHEEHGFRTRRYDARLVAIAHTRSVLDARIRSRAEAMIGAGWIDEVRGLLARGHADARAMHSVGYAQVGAYLRGEFPESELIDRVVRVTRTFARRQRTWLAKAPIEWLRAEEVARPSHVEVPP